MNRGIEKSIGPGADGYGHDCTGCKTCEHVCPTNFIKSTTEDQKLKIWNREFKVPVCKVDENLCTACGMCEEVCPFAIPQVTLFRNGNAVSKIPKTTCVGCGICAGACPNGAISQEELEPVKHMEVKLPEDIKGKNVVFACSRSAFPENSEALE